MNYDSKEAIADVAGADYQALVDRFAALAPVFDAISAERKALDDEIRARKKAAAAQIRLGAMKEDDKALYRDVIDSGVK